MKQLRGVLTGRGWMAVMLGWSPAQRRVFSGGSRRGRRQGSGGRECGAQAWMNETNSMGGGESTGGGGSLLKGAAGTVERGGSGGRDNRERGVRLRVP
jgi:hypothetical protein